jgi:hypothetical protein
VLLPLSEPLKLHANLDAAGRLLAGIAPLRQCHGGWLARDVEQETVTGFLRSYIIHDDIVVFRSDLIADWITERTVAGELTDWSVFVASPASERTVRLGGLDVGLVRRKLVSSESIGILTDPAHEGVDLPGGPAAYRRESGAYDAEAMRAARPATQGLLIVYPLDPAQLNVSGPDAVIALSLSLPHTSDTDTEWITNGMVANG